jgi:flagellar motor switch protein FliG
MNQPDDSFRKVALLVSALDRDTSDILLEQLDPQLEQQVRALMAEIVEVDPAEQQAAIHEFFGRDPAAPGEDGIALHAPHAPKDEYNPEAHLDSQLPIEPLEGIQLEGSLAQHLDLGHSLTRPVSGQRRSEHDSTASRPSQSAPRFHDSDMDHDRTAFLDQGNSEEAAEARDFEQVDPARLAACLGEEHPQVIALVLSRLTPQHAVRVVGHLPSKIQGEAVRRMAEVHPCDPQVISAIEQGLWSHLQQAPLSDSQAGGLSAIALMLEAADQQTRRNLVHRLQVEAPNLATRLRQQSLAFSDFEALDGITITAVLERAPAEVVRLALAGCSPEFANRVMSAFPLRQRQEMQRSLEQLGPTRLRDVELAQHQIVQLAERLEMAGEIRLPHRQWMPVAA